MLRNTNSLLSGNKNNSNEVQWVFSQVKGTLEDDFTEQDIISCVEFNSDGKLLACGDKGGRIVIFKRAIDSNDYDLYATFQSHEAEFDYLKSLEIEEKINKINWLDSGKNAAHFMLTTNDKTIKLWKLSERDRVLEGSNNISDHSSPNSSIICGGMPIGNGHHPRGFTTCDTEYFHDLSEVKIPKFTAVEPTVQHSLRRTFSNAHAFHINSISVNSDQETYISADELRINLWNLEVTDESFLIVDIKPANMEELTEVITCAKFHPQHCNIFAYATSRGAIKLCDMRQAALCDRYSKIFEEVEDTSFFSELIALISDLHFTDNGRYMITRDYLTVKVWDINMDKKPVETYFVHEYLRNKLCSLYENEYIFDKFECSIGGADNFIMTGSYNLFKIIDRTTKREQMFEVNKDILKLRQMKPRKVNIVPESMKKKNKKNSDEINPDSIDLTKRIVHTAWHPLENIIAVANTKNLYLFHDQRLC